MSRSLIFWGGILITALIVAFMWRVCVTVGVPLTDYRFDTVFKNSVYIFAVFGFLWKAKRWIRGNH